MITVNIHEAKTQLSKLIERAVRGEAYRLGGQFGALYANHAIRYDLPIRYNTTLKAKALGAYDRYLRSGLYGIERTLWRRRLI